MEQRSGWTVWNKRAGALLGKRGMMVWDMFRAHITDEIKEEVGKLNMCVIPGGLTSVLQPLDVCINKPFKDRVRQLWTEWIASGDVKTTKSGNMMKPDITVVSAWVKQAWDDIPADMVKRAFIKCSISNAMDGSEDNAVYEDDNQSDSDVDDGDDGDSVHDYYDDNEYTEQDFVQLFGECDSDDDNDFEGFE